MAPAAGGLGTELIVGVCLAAAGHSVSDTVVDVIRDPLDDTVWSRLSSVLRAREALRALRSHGIDARDLHDGRLHVIGWDARLLRWRLGVLLAGVDDLGVEWAATAELVAYHCDRRVRAGVEPEPWTVLGDVEAALRGCTPIPHAAPRIEDVDRLLELIEAAEDAYGRLIAEHVEYAERVLDCYLDARQPAGVDVHLPWGVDPGSPPR